MKVKELSKILFLDVETVPEAAAWKSTKRVTQSHWKKKITSKYSLKEKLKESNISDLYNKEAGIYAEFGKVVCISVACLRFEGDHSVQIKIKSFSGVDECSILGDFKNLMDKHYFDADRHFLCGHNVREFDIPFLARRMLINRIELPELFKVQGKKPWQLNYILDTMELWKFGDYKNYTSLDLLAHCLGIISPKSDMDGSMVSEVYYSKKDLQRIQSYCELDVLTTIKVFLKLMQFPIAIENVELIQFDKTQVL